MTDDLNRLDKLEKINKIKDSIKWLDSKTKEKIEKNLNVDKWLGNLINERLIVSNQRLATVPEVDTSRSDDITFLKEVPLRTRKPRRKLIRREFSIDDNDIDFAKVVIPDKRKRKLTEQENNRTKRQIIENEVEFIKQVPPHPRDRLKRRKINNELRRINTVFLQ